MNVMDKTRATPTATLPRLGSFRILVLLVQPKRAASCVSNRLLVGASFLRLLFFRAGIRDQPAEGMIRNVLMAPWYMGQQRPVNHGTCNVRSLTGMPHFSFL